MSRTRRNVAYDHYWGCTKKEAAEWAEKFKGTRYYYKMCRGYLLHGTDAAHDGYNTREYFNRAHRKGRANARNQLRPHLVLNEDFCFDNSVFHKAYKGVWWDIY